MTQRALLGHDGERYRRYRTQIAPGTPLRDGLDRIRLGHTGALVVLGTNATVRKVSTGGFQVDCEFSPTALRELAKMDGGIVLSSDLDRILAAGVHFTPSARLPTQETGTRHRTADRVAMQTNIPAVTVSATMGTITLFMAGLRYPIESSERILGRAEQALATLHRYRARLDEELSRLSVAELANLVTVADLARTVQAWEMTRRLSEELQGYLEALGTDGWLLELQYYELSLGIDHISQLIEADYPLGSEQSLSLGKLGYLPTGDLFDLGRVADALGLGSDLTVSLPSRGLRLITQVGQLSTDTTVRLMEHFGDLQGIVTAGLPELAAITGVGEKRARGIKDELTRLSDLG